MSQGCMVIRRGGPATVSFLPSDQTARLSLLCTDVFRIDEFLLLKLLATPQMHI